MPYCKTSFRRFEGIKLLIIQDDNLVQTAPEVVAKKECIECVKRPGIFAQPGLREEERVGGARAEAMGVQGFKDGAFIPRCRALQDRHHLNKNYRGNL